MNMTLSLRNNLTEEKSYILLKCVRDKSGWSRLFWLSGDVYYVDRDEDSTGFMKDFINCESEAYNFTRNILVVLWLMFFLFLALLYIQYDKSKKMRDEEDVDEELGYDISTIKTSLLKPEIN